MAEDSEAGRGPDRSGPEAAHIAMNAASRGAADAYLAKNSHLIDLQIADMEREDRLRHWSLRVRHISDVMKLGFELAVAFIVIAIAFFIGAAIWSAHQANGVVIESFSVPPDMAARGLTGEVVATQLQDRLAALQTATFSYRAPSSYANNWGDDIKVQIPDTGVSIGELNRYLRGWLGSETHITGEVWRTTNGGIAVTARAGASSSPVFTGKEADLDSLIQKAAESVYRDTQPYRFAIYLTGRGRMVEARAVLQHLIHTGSRDERAWAHLGYANVIVGATGDSETEIQEYERAVTEQPGLVLAYNDLANAQANLGHDEAALAALKAALALGAGKGEAALNPYYAQTLVLENQSFFAAARGDNRAALDFDHQIESINDFNSWEPSFDSDLTLCGALHDAACLRETWAHMVAVGASKPNVSVELNRMASSAVAQAHLEDWRGADASFGVVVANMTKLGPAAIPLAKRDAAPLEAVIDAHLGRLAQARALIGTTPLDCETCLFDRGLVDEVARNRGGAAYWFARADAYAPSFPFVDTEWGRMLLSRGDANGAIAKFQIANQRSPHFADPLEGWGEALMAKNRSDSALAKFEEADKDAPNWGRLHLKWGEALWWSGDKEGARKQFATAAGLDLTPSEKSELTRMRAAHG
jgi:tetratricopeptide (TPR) repeat protein